MNIEYMAKSGKMKTIVNVTPYRIIITGASTPNQFAPLSLGGGQSEWIWQARDEMNLWRAVNPHAATQQWLWGHETNGWIAWVDKKEAKRLKTLRLKPLYRYAQLICWPKIGILNGVLYLRDDGGNKSHVYGIPADAHVEWLAERWQNFPGWFHLVVNPKGKPILRDGHESFMPIFAPEGRRVKGKPLLVVKKSNLVPF